jgi:ribulose kinase
LTAYLYFRANAQNLPKSYSAAGMFFDLPDFLTAKATGSTARSLCSLSGKFGYDAETVQYRLGPGGDLETVHSKKN